MMAKQQRLRADGRPELARVLVGGSVLALLAIASVSTLDLMRTHLYQC